MTVGESKPLAPLKIFLISDCDSGTFVGERDRKRGQGCSLFTKKVRFSMSESNRPIHEIRLGRVKAAIWKNETENGTRFSVLLSRIYKTDSGWDSTNSFGRDELPLVAKCADMAHTWIFQQSDDAPQTDQGSKSSSRSDQRERARARS